METNTAVLSSFDKYTTFSYGGKKLTFRTCNGLERYTKILRWDKGYLGVMAKYRHKDDEVEEFIDLEPVLEGLYMDKESFLTRKELAGRLGCSDSTVKRELQYLSEQGILRRMGSRKTGVWAINR